ncbi:hypothetical protein PMAG_a0805 [Pseudoalteromonas mariniglutinosa NCIMB 1770]|nr:hypothetical protein [Pseudoalteromonas mariniglutinosa NCIMB 1770]
MLLKRKLLLPIVYTQYTIELVQSCNLELSNQILVKQLGFLNV